jgi:Leucine-rich repeat (LRR) protein
MSNIALGLDKLAALTKLDLSANQITDFPVELTALPKVQTLNLAYNKYVSAHKSEFLANLTFSTLG